MQNFQGKVAVVTGAADGIGKALAKKCVLSGMQTVLVDIDAKRLKLCEQELSKINANLFSVVADVTREKSIQELAQIIIQRFGKINILFNNAGIPGPIGPIWQVNFSALEQVIDVNLMGVIHGLRAFIPMMLKQNEECYVVNTASGAGLHTSANTFGYTLTKHAVVALSEVLYYDLLQNNIKNIHVSVLCPGAVKTNFAEKMQPTNSAELDGMIAYFKDRLKQGMSADEVAEKTFSAIMNNQFYILTDPDHKMLIQNRLEDIINERNPSRDL